MISKKEIKLFATFFIIYTLFAHYINWNENSRLDLTMAIVDEHRFEIDAHFNNTGDRAYYNGHYYSDKEPGMSLLAVPVYFFYKQFYGPPVVHHNPYNRDVSNSYLNLMLAVIIFTSALFGAISVVLVYKALRFFAAKETHRIIITVTYGLGTLVLIYSRLFMNHVVAMFFAFLSFYLVFLMKKKKQNLAFVSGLAGGFAVVTQLSTAAIVLGNAVLLLTFKKKKVFHFALGCLVGALPLLMYNYSIFHNPIEFTYFHMDESIWGFVSFKGQFQYRTVDALNIMLRLLFDPYRGLFFYSPILIFSFAGLWFMFKKYRTESLLIGAYFLVILIYNSQLHVWEGGSCFGPRHFVLLTPFLMLPLSYSFANLRLKYIIPFAAVSIFFSLLGIQFVYDTIYPTQPIFQHRFHSLEPMANPIFDYYLPRFLRYGPDSSLFFRAAGVRPWPFVNVAVVLAISSLIWWSEIRRVVIRK
jgi:hypothetical protein